MPLRPRAWGLARIACPRTLLQSLLGLPLRYLGSSCRLLPAACPARLSLGRGRRSLLLGSALSALLGLHAIPCTAIFHADMASQIYRCFMLSAATPLASPRGRGLRRAGRCTLHNLADLVSSSLPGSPSTRPGGPVWSECSLGVSRVFLLLELSLLVFCAAR